MDQRLLGGVAATVAVLTLPLGLLSGLFFGFEAAAVVFVVGWFLLTPLIPIVGNEVAPPLARRLRDGNEGGEGETDPLAELKSRYARGEIGDAEFERRAERLLEVNDLDSSTGDRARAEREPEPE